MKNPALRSYQSQLRGIKSNLVSLFFLNILNGQKRGGMVVQCFRWLGREAKLNAGAVFGKQGVWLYICLTALSEFGGSCSRLLTKIGKGRSDILNELRDKLFFIIIIHLGSRQVQIEPCSACIFGYRNFCTGYWRSLNCLATRTNIPMQCGWCGTVTVPCCTVDA